MPAFTAADGTRLAYHDDGPQDAPVLLCLSGLTRTAQDFDYVLPHLTSYRVLRPDYRGRGQSGWSGAETYTVPQEAADQIALLDHLEIEKAAILGTSRGGLIGMGLAATHKDRLTGLCLNDIGPALERTGLDRIKDFVGRNPAARSHSDMAQALQHAWDGFANVPHSRWMEEAVKHYHETPEGGLRITYDPALRQSFLAAYEAEEIDLWPFFDLCDGLPLALIRGTGSNLTSHATAAEMARRRPDMIWAEVPDRGHVPFLDEPEALDAIARWCDLLP